MNCGSIRFNFETSTGQIGDEFSLIIIEWRRKTSDVPRLLDEDEMQRQLNEKRTEIQEYRQIRSEICERREQDRKLRNAMKVAQLELYEQMQVGRFSV